MKPEPAIKFIEPGWNAPSRVKALCTTRNGGFSPSPFDSFNLAMHVGDEEENVLRNRDLLRDFLKLPAEPCWLQQTHSTRAIKIGGEPDRQADAAITREVGLVAVVMTADCLPILLCNRAGTEVAAIHAGWRGLADGIIEATLSEMDSSPNELQAWIGPGISQQCFEVGDEVRDIFMAKNESAISRFVSNRPGHWLCDLGGLARDRLSGLEVVEINHTDHCSYRDEAFFYSYRRNAVTGRMASLIWIENKA